ncbi:PHP domain-containing protein [candidate division KSB1 bacterium]|nr:PHP domain-containing protein [candidate division KSB1 bacterium]
MLADLHVHTHYSPDAISKVDTVLSVSADHGIDIIAVTDHQTTQAWKELADASRHYPVAIVFGQEMKIFRNDAVVGEVLCLFLDRPVTGRTLPELVHQVSGQGGLISIAHPFSERRHEFKAFDQIEDWSHIAIEVSNGRTWTPHDDQLAQSLSRQLDTMITAGSDAHTPFEIGSVYLEFDGRTTDDLKQAIRHHQVVIGGKPSPIFFSLLSGASRLGLEI